MKAREQRVLAVVPHYGVVPRANRWLEECVASLLRQTRRLDGVVVVDDCSPISPEPALQDYPGVALLRTETNVGPFAILDALFHGTQVDRILLQDSDDWSLPHRLEVLLEASERESADIVGSQLHQIYEGMERADAHLRIEVPEDPRAALLEDPVGHVQYLPTCLLRRQLVVELGGFASAMRFGADSELVRRAAFGGVSRNLGERLYGCRAHPGSLSRSPETGMGSEARRAVQARVQEAARRLVSDHLAGGPMDLGPLARRDQPVRLVAVHLPGDALARELAGVQSPASG